MKPAAVCVAVLLLSCGCAASVGETSLNLHQRAKFPNGTTYALSEFRMSEKDTGRRTGPLKEAGDKVTIWVAVSNAGRPIKAADVKMNFFYTDDRGQEVRSAESASSRNVVPAGGHDRISKTFVVTTTAELFRSKHLRIVLEVPSYPSVTFSGDNP